jgi:beta-glucanase (GH16 family)
VLPVRRQSRSPHRQTLNGVFKHPIDRNAPVTRRPWIISPGLRTIFVIATAVFVLVIAGWIIAGNTTFQNPAGARGGGHGAANAAPSPLTSTTPATTVPTTPATTPAPSTTTKDSAAGSPSPSRPGSAPTAPAALNGWTQVYAEDFSGTELGAGWGKYSGEIPSMPGGTWSPSHVQVTQGKLRLLTTKVNGQWTSGGVMNDVQAKTTYGKYLVRFRIDKANGVKYALLLWPDSEQWPMDGEIDFAEDGGGDRSATTATVIWGEDSASREQIQRKVTADFSSWHTIGVEWTPGQLVYTLDGKPWATVKTQSVPYKPMNLALQTEAGSCNEWITCIDSTTPATTTLEVDWVAVYRHT